MPAAKYTLANETVEHDALDYSILPCGVLQVTVPGSMGIHRLISYAPTAWKMVDHTVTQPVPGSTPPPVIPPLAGRPLPNL